MSTRQSNRVKQPSARLKETLPEPSVPIKLVQNGKGKGKGKAVKEDEIEQDEGEQIYCICRKPEGGRKMIECDECHEWFHFKCVRMTAAQAENIHVYICPDCEIKTGGERKSLKTSDISLLPSPPRSVSPVKEPEPEPSSSKRKRKPPKSTKKKGANSASKADLGEEVAEEVALEEEEKRYKSEPDSESESSAEGSDYGADERVEGKPGAKGTKKRIGRDDSGSGSDAEVSGDSLVRSIKKGRTRPSLLKRKRSTSSSPVPTSKQRKTSTANLGRPIIGSEWTNLRTFCLNKLQAAFGKVFEGYRRRQIWVNVRAVDVKAPSVGDMVDVDQTNPTSNENDTVQPDSNDASKDVSIDDPVKPITEEDLATIEFSEQEAAEIKGRADGYAAEVEKGIFEKNKEFVKEKGAFQPKPSYRSQYQSIISALEHDLRLDLQEGFATQTIASSTVASMTSKDLATEEQLAEIRKIEAESMKSSIRYEDAYAPVRYTKKILEDAEALQAIEEGIAGASRRREVEGSQVAIEEGVADASRRSQTTQQQKAFVDAEEAMDVQEDTGNDSDDVKEDDGTTIEDANANEATGAGRNVELESSPATMPAPLTHRTSSFSLRNVLGDVKHDSSAPGENEGDGEELPDFTDGFTKGDDEDEGSEHDFYAKAPTTREETQFKPVGPTEQEMFERLPVVWTGEIDNPDASAANIPRPKVEARQVAGPDLGPSRELWKRLLPQDPVVLIGRVREAVSAKYLLDNRLSASKELVVLAFSPTPDDASDSTSGNASHLQGLFDFYSSRERHAVHAPYGNTPPPGAPKEVYVVPLKPGNSFEFLDLMDRNLLPSRRTSDVLLCVIILPKNREMPPMPLPTQVTPPVLAPQPSIPTLVPATNPPSQGQPDISALLATLNPNVIQQMLAAGKMPSGNTIPAPFTASPIAPTPTAPAQAAPVLPPFAGTLPPPQMPPFPPSHNSPHLTNSVPIFPSPARNSPLMAAKPSPPVHPSRLAHIAGSSPRGSPPMYGQPFSAPSNGYPGSQNQSSSNRRVSQEYPPRANRGRGNRQ